MLLLNLPSKTYNLLYYILNKLANSSNNKLTMPELYFQYN